MLGYFLAKLANRGTMDEITLLDEDGTMIGARAKHLVHTDRTPLHLGFSCHLRDGDGRFLVTRRSLDKQTWAGVWTNSFCGHPRPGEPMESAVHRRAAEELGTTIADLRLVLPGYRYRAVDAGGVVENEICPVHVARIDGSLRPEPTEVAEWSWIDAERLVSAVADAPFAFSPWMREQLALLRELGEV